MAMSRYIKELQRSLNIKLQRVFFQGGEKRHLQQRFDIHKLFLFTSYHAQQQLLQDALPDDLAAQLIDQAKTLPFEQQQQIVQQNLHSQLVNIARSINTCLVQQQDHRPAAAALERSWHSIQDTRQQQQHLDHHHHQQQQQQQQQQEQGLGSGLSGLHSSGELQQQQQPQGQLISQQQLSQLLQQQLGYSLSVRPSNIKHEDAGSGLFVDGEVPPGSLIALFPGLVYSKEVHRRMPGYPRMDMGNPYLTARYDGRIVDSLPWGRGWLADGSMARNMVAPRKRGVIGSMAAASDGPQQPVPDTVWVAATTGEAAALEMLEGRNPLAMAHYANHPGPGSVPNAIIASFTFKPVVSSSSGDGDGSSYGGGGSSSSSSSSSSSLDPVEPWVRAYVPNINYSYQCHQEDLLTKEVSCVGLVSVTALPAGTEVLFNYRLSPSLLGRPRWYVPVDSREENMRWA